MFNVYEFDRRCTALDQERKKHIQSQLIKHRQMVKNQELNVQYRQRVGKFIKKMINESASNPNFQDTIEKSREFNLSCSPTSYDLLNSGKMVPSLRSEI